MGAYGLCLRYRSQKSRTETPNRGSGSLECSANNKRSFQEITGFETESSWGVKCISEYCNFQEQLGSDLGDGIALRRLDEVGVVFDWETTQVEQDSRVGRKWPL